MRSCRQARSSPPTRSCRRFRSGIAALIEAHGGEAIALGIAKDDLESVVTLARAGKAADILLTIGGASVGERDLVATALKSEGLELDFWKVAMRPGKPMLYGRLGSQRVLGLPGNPVSALLCAHIFLLPMMRRMLGVAEERAPDARGRARRGGRRQRRARALHAGQFDVAGGRHARGAPPALAGLVLGGGVGAGRLPDRASATRAGPARRRPGHDHAAGRAIKSAETRIARRRLSGLFPGARYRILGHSCLQNTNRTYKLFMICTGGHRTG